MPLSLRCEIDQMFNPGKTLHEVDPELWAAVQQENQRQEDHIELIASENYASPAVNMSGKWFNVLSYGLNDKEEIDYAALERIAREHKPKLILAGASAYSLRIDFERIGRVAKEVGAYFMVDMAHYAGLIAAGEYPSPVGIADFVTSTTHKTLRGPRGGFILMKAEHEKAVNSAVFPGLQGGPLMHCITANAVAFK